MFQFTLERGLGSPPRGRGKGIYRVGQRKKVRITPAWAGKSVASESRRMGSRDHPRVGGEKPKTDKHALVIKGSPPRGRGKGPAGAAP